jgi:HEAT repeat protein
VKRDRSKDAPKTAAELMAELQADPEFVARMRDRERQRQESTEAYRRALEPLLKDLAAIGFRVKSVGELLDGKTNYHAAIPILLEWLPRISDPHAKEDLVRTLSVPWAKPAAAPQLIQEFKAANDPTGEGLRWAIANGLAVVADDAVFEDLLELVQDTQYGKARQMLALALGNMQNPHAATVLVNLLDDEHVVGHAVMALGKLKVPAVAEMRLRALLVHPTDWVRDEARKTLAGLESSEIH